MCGFIQFCTVCELLVRREVRPSPTSWRLAKGAVSVRRVANDVLDLTGVGLVDTYRRCVGFKQPKISQHVGLCDADGGAGRAVDCVMEALPRLETHQNEIRWAPAGGCEQASPLTSGGTGPRKARRRALGATTARAARWGRIEHASVATYEAER